MEVDKFVNSVERYVREFILYLLSFFWTGKSGGEGDPVLEPLNRTAIFAVMSAAAGAYLWNIYIYDGEGGVHDLPRVLTDALLRWFAYGLFLYGLMLACRVRPHILRPVLAVFKVFSVAHILSVFSAYIARNVVWFLTGSDFNIALGPTYAARTAYIVQGLLVLLYMPREIAAITPAPTSRPVRLTVTVLFLLVTTTVAFANYLDPEAGRQSHAKIAGEEQPAKQAEMEKGTTR